MNAPAIQRFDSQAAWKPSDYPTKDSFAIDLEPRHIAVLEAEVERFKATGGGHEDLSQTSFPLTEIADEIALWRTEVHDGRGMILLRGVPVERIDLAELAPITS